MSLFLLLGSSNLFLGVLNVRLCCREMNRVCHDNSLWRGRFVVLGECVTPPAKEAPMPELQNNTDAGKREGSSNASPYDLTQICKMDKKARKAMSSNKIKTLKNSKKNPSTTLE